MHKIISTTPMPVYGTDRGGFRADCQCGAGLWGMTHSLLRKAIRAHKAR